MKKFPLTIYALIVTILIFTASDDLYHDSNFIFFIIVWFLAMPLTAVNQILVLFDIKDQVLFWIFPIFVFFILDLLIFCLRNGRLKTVFNKIISNFNEDKRESK